MNERIDDGPDVQDEVRFRQLYLTGLGIYSDLGDDRLKRVKIRLRGGIVTEAANRFARKSREFAERKALARSSSLDKYLSSRIAHVLQSRAPVQGGGGAQVLNQRVRRAHHGLPFDVDSARGFDAFVERRGRGLLHFDLN